MGLLKLLMLEGFPFLARCLIQNQGNESNATEEQEESIKHDE